VRFGATVSYKINTSPITLTFQIVGVDEADVAKQKIAFVAPIAVALTGHTIGDVVSFNMGGELRKLEVLNIQYD
jgi:transcription elongation factor GreB